MTTLDPAEVAALAGPPAPPTAHARARTALGALRDALDDMRLPIALEGDRLAGTVGDLAVRHLATLQRLIDVHEQAAAPTRWPYDQTGPAEAAARLAALDDPLERDEIEEVPEAVAAKILAPTAGEVTEAQLREMPREQFDELTAYARHRALLAQADRDFG